MTVRRVLGERINVESPELDIVCRVYFTWYQLIVTFIIPSIVMVTCYSTVINSLRRATNNMVIMTNRYNVELMIFKSMNSMWK